MSDDVRHPEVEVELVGHDGNALAILGRVTEAMRRAGVSNDEIDEYLAEAKSGDYDELLRTTMRWVQVS